MLKDKRVVIAAVVCLALVGAYFLLQKDSPEKRIRNQLKQLCDSIGKEAGEPKTTLVIKNERLAGMLADELEVSGDASLLVGSHASTEFLRLMQQGRFMFQSVDLSLTKETITIETDKKAVVDCVATLRTVGKGGQTQSERLTRTVKITLVKPEDKWLFQKFHVTQITEQ